MDKIAALIPSYKREDRTINLVERLLEIEIIKYIVVCQRDWSALKIAELKRLSKKIIVINQNTPGIGCARRTLYMKADTLNITHALMLDNDIEISTYNLNIFLTLTTFNNFNLSSIDLTDCYTHNKISKYDWHFSCILLIKKHYLKQLSVLSNVNYYEDKEIIYLLKQKIFLYCRKDFDYLRKNDIIGNDESSAFGLIGSSGREKRKKKAINELKKIYGKENITVTIREDKTISFDFKYKQKKVYNIYFEGTDRSGKSSLLNKFKQQDNHFHLTHDRGPISSCVYNDFFKKGFDSKQYLKHIHKNSIIVYCECDYLDYLKRKDNNKYSEKEFKLQQRLFKKYLKKLKNVKIINLNTTLSNKEETLLDLQYQIYDEVKNEDKLWLRKHCC